MRIAITLILLLAASCAQVIENNGETVTVSVSGAMTRTVDGSDDCRVALLRAYVFREDGSLEAKGSSESSDIILSVTSGKKTIVAIANSPEPETAKDLYGIRNSISNLSDNAPDALVMYGENTADIHSDSDVTVELKRLAAKISIKKISNRLNDRYKNMKLVINNIYLINAAGSSPYYNISSPPQHWMNKRALSNKDCPSLLFDSVNAYSIALGNSYDVTHDFYCYPNPTTEDTSQEEWCPRFTRLVVQASLGGEIQWYPISIPEIKRNCKYEITELAITRPGSDSPDKPVDGQDIEINLTISPWGNEQSEEITI